MSHLKQFILVLFDPTVVFVTKTPQQVILLQQLLTHLFQWVALRQHFDLFDLLFSCLDLLILLPQSFHLSVDLTNERLEPNVSSG